MLDFLFGSPARTEQIQRFSPQQQQALSRLLGMGLSGAQQSQNFNLSPVNFGPIESQARTNFQQQTVPSIAERFTALAPGAQQSSAFAQSLGRAGSGLEQALASMRAQYGFQNNAQQLQAQGMRQGALQNYLGLGLQPYFDPLYRPEQPGVFGSTGASLSSLAPLLYGAGLLGGPAALGMGGLGLGLGALSGFGR